jgi:hypothetical protein
VRYPSWLTAYTACSVTAQAAKTGGPYLVVLKTGGTVTLDLSQAKSRLKFRWFNPRTGEFQRGKAIKAGQKVTLGPAPSEPDLDWIVLLD